MRDLSEYVRELLRQDQTRGAVGKLEALLLEGIDSGTPIQVNPEYWKRKREQLIARHSRKQQPQKTDA